MCMRCELDANANMTKCLLCTNGTTCTKCESTYTLDTGIKNCITDCPSDTNYPHVWNNKAVIDNYKCTYCNISAVDNMTNCIFQITL